MKSKTLSLVAGMVLLANVGFAQTAELNKTADMDLTANVRIAQATELNEMAGMPDILSSMDTANYQAMNQEEMAIVEGKV